VESDEVRAAQTNEEKILENSCQSAEQYVFFINIYFKTIKFTFELLGRGALCNVEGEIRFILFPLKSR